MNLNTNFLKKQLNIESTFDDDDELLNMYLDAATRATEKYLNVDLVNFSGTTHQNIELAIYYIATHFYVNRTPVAFASAQHIPLTYQFLIEPYKNLI